ncbi:YunC family protein [Terribacillus halophilus]|uniref:YunC family protein n=1 Tax=Terribacillus halophilus TaxID=361279 RepID=UPI0035675A42
MTVEPIFLEGKPFTAVTVKLPKTTLLVVSNDVGYIMCGALDVDLLNEKLADRNIISGRAVGVKTIQQLLDAPLEKVTDASAVYGWKTGMIGKDALLLIA